MNRQEEIAAIFSIFHDGTIAGHEFADGVLRLTVRIEYLAKRINPSFTQFRITLYGVKDILFKTWPNKAEEPSVALSEAESIFLPQLDILEGNVKGDSIKVVCSQAESSFDYCGGELYFRAERAEVTDETGRQYSTQELEQICEAYWDEWEKQKPSA